MSSTDDAVLRLRQEITDLRSLAEADDELSEAYAAMITERHLRWRGCCAARIRAMTWPPSVDTTAKYVVSADAEIAACTFEQGS
jgi:hypothetical protein